MLPLSQLRTIASACLALALLCLLPLPVLAQKTIYIDGGCSFSQAFRSANAKASDIAQGDYNIGDCEQGDIDSSKFDTIILTESRGSGAGSGIVTSKIIFDGRFEKKNHKVTGQAAGNSYHQIFQVGANGDLTVKNVEIRNTRPSGDNPTTASVYIEVTAGRATIQNVTFENEESTSATITTAVVGIRQTGGKVDVWHSRFEDSQSTDDSPVVSGSGVTVYRSVFINNSGETDGFVVTGATVSASTITESTATNTGAPKFAVKNAKLRNVTLAHNNSGGITAPDGLKNSILYYNSGVDCGGTVEPRTIPSDWGPTA